MKPVRKWLFPMLFITSAGVLAQDGWITLEKTSGSELFREKCGMCHGDAMGMGTGILGRRMPAEQALLESRDDLQGTFIKTVVRGGLGVMLPISRGEVSDPQLVAIIDYLAKED